MWSWRWCRKGVHHRKDRNCAATQETPRLASVEGASPCELSKHRLVQLYLFDALICESQTSYYLVILPLIRLLETQRAIEMLGYMIGRVI